MNNMFQVFAQFMQNPLGLLSQRFNLPQNINDPQAIIQHLLNSGQITQDQVNQAMQMRQNPIFKGLMK